METGPQTWPNTRMALDKETEERIDQPVSEEAERETRLRIDTEMHDGRHASLARRS